MAEHIRITQSLGGFIRRPDALAMSANPEQDGGVVPTSQAPPGFWKRNVSALGKDTVHDLLPGPCEVTLTAWAYQVIDRNPVLFRDLSQHVGN